MDLPVEVEIDAWTGAPVRSPLVPQARSEAADRQGFAKRFLLPVPPVPLTEWRHPSVGWGLVLPENAALSAAQRATAEDAPAAIQRLLEARGGPVFRYDPGWPLRHSHLRRYFPNGKLQEPMMVGSQQGVGPNQVPRYLLIYGSPEQIPWTFQWTLGAAYFVGRLDLEGEALERYVEALLTDWAGSSADPRKQTVWSVDHQAGDITSLMRRVLAVPLFEKLKADVDLSPDCLDVSQTTHAELWARLASTRPGFVITTSHGVTAPLEPPGAMRGQLGLPVDVEEKPLDLSSLLSAWQPDGAIWYAHACCSAGADASTGFDGLVAAGSAVDRVLKAVAQSGSLVAPLPRALLGADKPLRAFVGHVEPTFDWTLREPSTKQLLTTSLVEAMYQRLFLKSPIGHALAGFLAEGPQLVNLYDKAIDAGQQGEDTLGTALALKLMARDHERLVILGDPTVALPL